MSNINDTFDLQEILDETIRSYQEERKYLQRVGRSTREVDARLEVAYLVACDMERTAKIMGHIRREGSLPEDLPRYQVARAIESSRLAAARGMSFAAQGKLRVDGEPTTSPCQVCPVQDVCDYTPDDRECLHNCSLTPPDGVAVPRSKPARKRQSEPRPAKPRPAKATVQTHLDFENQDPQDIY